MLALPFRYERIAEMLAGDHKLSVADCERMQQDVTNLAAKRFQRIVSRHAGAARGELKGAYARFLRWDARMTAESPEAALFAVWSTALRQALVASPLASAMDLRKTLDLLDKEPSGRALERAYQLAVAELEKRLGKDRAEWRWGRLHTISFTHPLRVSPKYAPLFHRGPLPRPGDANTVNAAGGQGLRQTSGASYRQILDLADWDRSVMTNVPGESGNPESEHYSDLLEDWAAGRYHPMPYSRKAVEAATVERIRLLPARP